jgi:hypothetical protein
MGWKDNQPKIPKKEEKMIEYQSVFAGPQAEAALMAAYSEANVSISGSHTRRSTSSQE